MYLTSSAPTAPAVRKYDARFIANKVSPAEGLNRSGILMVRWCCVIIATVEGGGVIRILVYYDIILSFHNTLRTASLGVARLRFASLPPNRANGRLGRIIGAAKSSVIVVTIHRHLLAKPRVIRAIIHEFGVTRGRWDAGRVGIRVDATR